MIRVGTQNETVREEWLARVLRGVPAGSRILDAGAGELKYKRFCDHLSYVAQDFGQYDGQGDESGLQMGSWDQTKLDIVCDITAIPEPDASFDAIMCVEVLEHLPNPLLALHEFARLLRPGGQLFLTAPFCSLTHFAPFYFFSGFSRYFYEKHLPEYGFSCVEMESNGNFFHFVAQELRRINYVAEKYSGGRPSIFERVLVRMMLITLDRLSKRDVGSAEILNFGWHVRAIRE